jgi:Cu(I)/Ag(I) efflux system membrane fusion protein
MKEILGSKKRAIGFYGLLALAVAVMLFPRTSFLEETAQTKAHTEHLSATPAPQQESGGYSHGAYPKKMEHEKADHETGETIRLSPEMLKLSDIRTAPVQYRRLVKEIQTVGEIAYDERRVKVVSAWIGGRIDKLYVDFTGINVKKGDPLTQIYSPELVSTQQEFLLALETRGRVWALGNQAALRSATGLVEATRQRLLLWGISKEQIDEIERTRKVSTHMTIHAPIGGTVIHKRAYEGQYVKMGEKLYTIADLTIVWAIADVFEYEMAWVKPGQKVSITTPAYPEKTFTGTVSFIDPFLSTKTRSVKVRMDVPNPHLALKPGMFAEARLKIPHKDQRPVLAIPHTAVLDTGVRKLAYLDLGEGVFRPVDIRVGSRAGNWIPVLAGLKKGQHVAVSANYLIDSQRTLGAGGSGEFGGAIGHGGH